MKLCCCSVAIVMLVSSIADAETKTKAVKLSQGYSTQASGVDVEISRDGRRLAGAVRRNGRTGIEIFDVNLGKSTLYLSYRAASSVTFSPNGRFLAATPGVGRRNTKVCDITIWDLGTGKPAKKIRSSERLTSLAYSPDGKLLAAGIKQYFPIKTRQAYGYGGVILFDVASGLAVDRRLIPRANHLVRHLAYSPDGRHVATAANRQVDLWQVTNRSVAHKKTLPGGNRVAFSPDGRLLACSLPEPQGKKWVGNILIYDTRTKESRKIGSHDAKKDANVLWISFSQNGERLVSAGFDGVVKVWQTKSGKLISETEVSKKHGVGFAAFDNRGQVMIVDRPGRLLKWQP